MLPADQAVAVHLQVVRAVMGLFLMMPHGLLQPTMVTEVAHQVSTPLTIRRSTVSSMPTAAAEVKLPVVAQEKATQLAYTLIPEPVVQELALLLGLDGHTA